jgi:hypothetical protein
MAANGNYVYAGMGGGYGVYRSTDYGMTWTQTLNNQYVWSLAVNGNYVYAGTYSGVFVSIDNGTNWTLTSLNQTVYALSANGNNVFAGTYIYGVYLSTDNGANWTQTPLDTVTVWSLAVNGNYVFAGTRYSGVFLSTNNGANWTQTSLNNRFVDALAVNGNYVFAGSSDNYGVFVTNDNGASWTPRNKGLGNLGIRALCIFNNYIFAGTFGSSVYRRPLGELTGIKPISGQIPALYALSQNFPNPFNPVTKIKFDISERNVYTSIRVYDILGEEIEILVDESLQPGSYEVEWDASNYPSGVYYYTLKTEQFKQTRKAVLIK